VLFDIGQYATDLRSVNHPVNEAHFEELAGELLRLFMMGGHDLKT
jgi:hypothetical protein